MWLNDAMITNTCYKAVEPKIGLRLNYESSKMKLYMEDTGLLVTHTFSDKKYIDNNLYRDILYRNLSINEGMIFENIVAQMLKANGHKLFFYSEPRNTKKKDTNLNGFEIDFLISKDSKISPIEVKSKGYTSHKSLDKLYLKYKNYLGSPYIIYSKDLQIKDDIICIPVYMTLCL